MYRVFHLSTFRPLVDNAISCAHRRRRCVFIDSKKQCVVPCLGSLDSEAGHLVTLKTILNYRLKYLIFI